MASNIVRFDSYRTKDFSAITGSYTAVGSPFAHPMRVLHFINKTDADLSISFDGINDNTVIAANGFALYDLTSDQDRTESFRYEQGTQVFVKQITVPSTGTLYLVAIYGKGE